MLFRPQQLPCHVTWQFVLPPLSEHTLLWLSTPTKIINSLWCGQLSNFCSGQLPVVNFICIMLFLTTSCHLVQMIPGLHPVHIIFTCTASLGNTTYKLPSSSLVSCVHQISNLAISIRWCDNLVDLNFYMHTALGKGRHEQIYMKLQTECLHHLTIHHSIQSMITANFPN